MGRYTLFISDLHLSHTKPETTYLLHKFIDSITMQADALYILGDLFQFWVGDDDRSPYNEQVKTILKKASNKLPVYLMPGNRDFLLGQLFAHESGCNLIDDPYVVSLYGKNTGLTHGDMLCTKDSRYGFFRNIIRFPLGIKLFLKMPLALRLQFATNIQQYSAKMKSAKSKEMLAVQMADTQNLLRKFDLEQLIHGHTHIIETEELAVDNKKAQRISLGEWDQQGSVLVYHDNHHFEFQTLS